MKIFHGTQFTEHQWFIQHVRVCWKRHHGAAWRSKRRLLLLSGQKNGRRREIGGGAGLSHALLSMLGINKRPMRTRRRTRSSTTFNQKHPCAFMIVCHWLRGRLCCGRDLFPGLVYVITLCRTWAARSTFSSLEDLKEWMELIYFRKWVSGEGKRLDSENKHIFYTLGCLLFYHAAPGVDGEMMPVSAWMKLLHWVHCLFTYVMHQTQSHAGMQLLGWQHSLTLAPCFGFHNNSFKKYRDGSDLQI